MRRPIAVLSGAFFDAVYGTGQRNIVMQAIGSSEVEMTETSTVFSANGMSTNLECGGTLTR